MSPMNGPQGPDPAETYEQYLGPAIAHPWTRVLLEFAAPKPGEWVLDVACGTGSVARHVAPMVGREGKVVALDISPAMLAVARAQPVPPGVTIEWREGNAVGLDLPADAFDLVLCQQGLQFFPDRAASVREMRRVLQNGGRVVISVWQALQRHPVYEALFEATARHLGAAVSTLDVSFSLSDPEELRRVLNDAGFRAYRDHAMVARGSCSHAGALRPAHGAGSGDIDTSVCEIGYCRAFRARGCGDRGDAGSG